MKIEQPHILMRKFANFIVVACFFLMLLGACVKQSEDKRPNKLIISHQLREKIYLTKNIKPGDKVSFHWEHSFEHIPWNEYYVVEQDNRFRLDSIAVAGFGAGIPAEMDCTYRYANGMVYMENIKGSYFAEFNWINSQTQLKGIYLNDELIVTGADLPEHEKIKLEIRCE